MTDNPNPTAVTLEMVEAGIKAGDASYYGSHLIRPLPPELLVDIYRAMRALEPPRVRAYGAMEALRAKS